MLTMKSRKFQVSHITPNITGKKKKLYNLHTNIIWFIKQIHHLNFPLVPLSLADLPEKTFIFWSPAGSSWWKPMFSTAPTVLNNRSLFTSSTNVRCNNWLRMSTIDPLFTILAFFLELKLLIMLPSGPNLVHFWFLEMEYTSFSKLDIKSSSFADK